ncbi:fimbrial protein [Escherichia coli]|uniref:fimbrial protein n=3 Tax=Pseudomonadota TaxID=1224 RepID=UPI00397F281F
MSSAAVSAAEGDESVTTTVNGGVIHFKGEVVNAACAIDSESMNQTVELGQVRSSRLAKAGDLSSAVGFNIKLNDCDTNVSSNAAVAFLGTTVTSNDDTLALQSSAAGSAQNVGIQILDRTQGKKENTLRIINATNHQLPGDRESLFWVNVKAIPAMEKDQKNENTLQLAIISRIKMFYRPTHLAMAPEEAPAMLRFRRSGSILTLINPTPYFITVTNMKAGNSNLPNTMVPPKGEVSVDIPHAVTGDISFQTINDYGALTPLIKATMQ